MAGDWIKFRVSLLDDPRPRRIARTLGVSDVDLIIGKLMRVWCWFDQHTRNGTVEGFDHADIDEVVRYPGFASAMAAVGWLQEGASDTGEPSVTLPRFDEHNGITGKRRAVNARASATYRSKQGVSRDDDGMMTQRSREDDGVMTGTSRSDDELMTRRLPREEKRREETTPPIVPPSLDSGVIVDDTGAGPLHIEFPTRAFKAYYAAHPKPRVGESIAWRSWYDLFSSGEEPATIARLMAALEAWKKSPEWTRDDGQFVKGASKFLTERLWECPPAAPKTASRYPSVEEVRAARKRKEAQSDG